MSTSLCPGSPILPPGPSSWRPKRLPSWGKIYPFGRVGRQHSTSLPGYSVTRGTCVQGKKPWCQNIITSDLPSPEVTYIYLTNGTFDRTSNRNENSCDTCHVGALVVLFSLLPAWQQTICCWHSWSTSSHCTSPCWCSWSNVEEVLYFRDKIVIGPAPPHYLHTIDLSIISGKFWETCSKQFSLYSLWTRDFTLEIGRNFSTELGMQLGNINHSFVSASHWCETWWGVKLKCIYLLSCWKLKYSLFYFTLSIFWKLNLVQQNIVFVFSSSVTNKVKRV